MSDATDDNNLMAEAEALLQGQTGFGSNVAPASPEMPPNVKMAADGVTPTTEPAVPEVKTTGPVPKTGETVKPDTPQALPQDQVTDQQTEPKAEESAPEPTTETPKPPQESSGWVQARQLQGRLVEAQGTIKDLQTQLSEARTVASDAYTAEQIAKDPMAVLNAVQGSMAILGEQLEGKKESTPIEKKPKVDPEIQKRLDAFDKFQEDNARLRVENVYRGVLADSSFKLLQSNPGAVQEMIDFGNAYVEASPHGKAPNGIPLTPEGQLLTPQWIAGQVQEAWRTQAASFAQNEEFRKLILGDAAANPNPPPTTEPTPPAPKPSATPTQPVQQQQPVVAQSNSNPADGLSDDDEEQPLWVELEQAAALVKPGAWGENS